MAPPSIWSWSIAAGSSRSWAPRSGPSASTAHSNGWSANTKTCRWRPAALCQPGARAAARVSISAISRSNWAPTGCAAFEAARSQARSAPAWACTPAGIATRITRPIFRFAKKGGQALIPSTQANTTTTIDHLIDTAAFLFDVERRQLLSRSRSTRVVAARQAIAWTLRQRDWTLEDIGNLLGRDHTTIIASPSAVPRKARQTRRFAEKLGGLRGTAPAAVDPPETANLLTRIKLLEQRVAELEAALRARQGETP